jgi:hypothetical protein
MSTLEDWLVSLKRSDLAEHSRDRIRSTVTDYLSQTSPKFNWSADIETLTDLAINRNLAGCRDWLLIS